MPPNKGIFNRKGMTEAEARRLKKGPTETEESGLLDEIAAGYYGGDPSAGERPASPYGRGPGQPPSQDGETELPGVPSFLTPANLRDFSPFGDSQAADLYVAPEYPFAAVDHGHDDEVDDDDEYYQSASPIPPPAMPELPMAAPFYPAEAPFHRSAEPIALGASTEPEDTPFDPSMLYRSIDNGANPAPIADADPSPEDDEYGDYSGFGEPEAEPAVASAVYDMIATSNLGPADEPPAPAETREVPLSPQIERLQRGLEFVITEDQVMSLSARAIGQIAPDLDTELLLRTESGGLERALASGPKGDGPGCAVGEARACPSIRLGRMLMFENSEFLDACPHLASRVGDPCQAVCIPFTSPDESGGVLHATAPLSNEVGDAVVDELVTAMMLISRRSYEIRSGTVLGTDGLGAAVAKLLEDRFGGVGSPATSEPATGSTEPSDDQFDRQPTEPDSFGDVSRLYTDDTGEEDSEALADTELEGPEVVEAEVGRLMEQGRGLALGLAHLDKFRLYNRTHGIAIGDAAVERFRDIARVVVRPADTLAGDGGDEFFLVLPDTSANDAAVICDRIRAELAASFVDESLPPFTVSIGIADTDDGADFDELLELVERAVVQAEAAGRDIVVTARSIIAKGDRRLRREGVN